MAQALFASLAALATLRKRFVEHYGDRHQGGCGGTSPEQITAPVYSLEHIVGIAGALAQNVREKHIFGGGDSVFGKLDASPVTVADLAIQVLITTMLKQTLGVDTIRLVGEEDTQVFDNSAAVARKLSLVSSIVAQFLPQDAAAALGEPVTPEYVMKTLREGNDPGGEGTFWTLDPIDGTKGYILKGGQYAIGLARIEDGRVVRSVIGCPALSANYVIGDPRQLGCVYSATRGGGVFMHPTYADGNIGPAKPCSVVAPDSKSVMKLAVSRAHEGPGGVVRHVAAELGMHPQPIEIDSMVKYVLMVRNEAHLYARAYGCIWDYAPGCLMVEEAGGVLSTLSGEAIDFSDHGRGRRVFIVAAATAELHQAALDGIRVEGRKASLAGRRVSVSDVD